MPSKVLTKITAIQYFKLGEDPPGIRLELVNGKIVISRTPGTQHAYALAKLFGQLASHIKSHESGLLLGNVDHVLSPYDVRHPDIFYFSAERMHLVDEGPIHSPPDLAIEIISPGSERVDRIEKFEAYRAFGIPLYWIIDPKAHTAKAFKLRRKKYALAGSGRGNDEVSFPPFDELKISLGDLWWPPK